MNTALVRVWFGVWILTGALLGAQAGEGPDFEWLLDPPAPALGEVARLTLRMVGLSQPRVPDLQVPGLSARLMAVTNERVTVFRLQEGQGLPLERPGAQAVWTLRALRTGGFRLSGLELEAGGRRFALPSFEWQTQPQGPQPVSSGFTVSARLDPPALVPDLQAVYELTWWVPEELAGAAPWFYLPAWESPLLEWAEAPQNASSAAGQHLDSPRGAWIAQILDPAEDPDRRQRRGWRVRLPLRSRKAGLERPPGLLVNFSQGGRSLFTWAAPEQTWEVQALPDQGRPEGFPGLVGQLRLDWSLPAGRYRPGEALPLLVRVEGLWNRPLLDVDALIRPVLSFGPYLITGVRPLGDRSRQYELRVSEPGRHEWPGLSLAYYDPVRRRYAQAETGPLRFEIAAGPRSETSEPAAGSAWPAPASGPGTPEPLSLPELPVPAGLGWGLAGLSLAPLAGLGVLLGRRWRYSLRRRRRLASQVWQAAWPAGLPEGPSPELRFDRVRALLQAQKAAWDPCLPPWTADQRARWSREELWWLHRRFAPGAGQLRPADETRWLAWREEVGQWL